jgi:hypothetical protein
VYAKQKIINMMKKMKSLKKIHYCLLLLFFLTASAEVSVTSPLTPSLERKTHVAIKQNMFYINGEPTYKNVYWQANKIEGLLFNARLVQGIFDDENPETRKLFAYSDTGVWDAERNTKEFIHAMASWKEKGLLAFTLNLQGGSPTGYGNLGWRNSAFNPDGSLKQPYLNRLEKILDHADQLGMVVILGYFYFGQDETLKDEKAVLKATDAITDWLIAKKYRNLLVEINNETDIYYDHAILQAPRIHELIDRVKKRSQHQLLVSTSFSGGTLPTNAVMNLADFILIHGNSVESPEGMVKLIRSVKQSLSFHGQPILVNEDDHYNFAESYNHFTVSLREYVSWGYFDYRIKNETFDDGFQSVPVNWKISSQRKQDFFNLLAQITTGDKKSSRQLDNLKQYVGTWYSADALTDTKRSAKPSIKMEVTPVLSGQSIQVTVYRREAGKWKAFLAELISYDAVSDQIIALGQNDQAQSFIGKGYFANDNTWYMKDYNFNHDFMLNVLFHFQQDGRVILRGIAPNTKDSWSINYVRE